MKRIFIFAASVGLSAVLASVALADGDGLFSDTTPNQNVVQPEQSRGQLGGLASGAPTFASNLRDLRGPGNIAAAQGMQQPVGGAAVVQGQTAVQSQTVAVEKQTITTIQSFQQLSMVIHHCIMNSPHKFQGGPIPFSPAGGNFEAPIPAVAHSLGDLQIVGLGMVADATPQQGPLYRVTLLNNSETPSRHFEVSLIAVRGQLAPSSPVVTVHVDKIAAGGTHQIDVQLPIGVMSIAGGTQAAPFESLVVAIDSFDALMESNELNNVAILTRGQIALIEVATTSTTTTVATPTEVATPNVAAPNSTDHAGIVPSDAALAPNSNDSAAPTPGDATVNAPAQQNVAPQPAPQQGVAPQGPPQQNAGPQGPPQQNAAPQGPPQQNVAPQVAPQQNGAPQGPATGNGAPAEQAPQPSNSSGLESLVPPSGGNGSGNGM